MLRVVCIFKFVDFASQKTHTRFTPDSKCGTDYFVKDKKKSCGVKTRAFRKIKIVGEAGSQHGLLSEFAGRCTV